MSEHRVLGRREFSWLFVGSRAGRSRSAEIGHGRNELPYEQRRLGAPEKGSRSCAPTLGLTSATTTSLNSSPPGSLTTSPPPPHCSPTSPNSTGASSTCRRRILP